MAGTSETGSVDYNKRVMRVLLYIQANLDEALSVGALAEIANLSPFYFERLFRGMVGESLLEHVRRLRLERAALHLKSTERKVSRIAFDAGYETHEAFTRAFRSLFETSPSAYRQQNRYVPEAPSPSNVHYSEDGGVHSFTPLTEDVIMEDVKVMDREDTRVAFVRHIGPYEECHGAWDRLCRWAGPAGLFGPKTVLFGLSHDDPEVTDGEKIRYDACIVIDDSVTPPEGIDVQVVPGGRYATMLHRGSFDKLSITYAAFFAKWLPDSGYEVRDLPSVEQYLTNPDETPEDEMLTQLWIPLKRAE